MSTFIIIIIIIIIIVIIYASSCHILLVIFVGIKLLPLWSSGQSSWLQIQRSRFESWHYQIFREVVVWNGVHSASWVQLRSYLEEKVAAPV
jgi:hypothetical protein